MTSSESQSEADQRLLEVRVATADGIETAHTYPLRNPAEAQEVADNVQQKVEDAFSGITSYLVLPRPLVMYNPGHIVRVTFEVIARQDYTEVVGEAEGRGPIGFRPS